MHCLLLVFKVVKTPPHPSQRGECSSFLLDEILSSSGSQEGAFCFLPRSHKCTTRLKNLGTDSGDPWFLAGFKRDVDSLLHSLSFAYHFRVLM